MLINRLRLDRAYERLEDEEGLSLVELMVSLIIVGVVLSALASTIVASLRAITKNQREARAIALQTEMVERFQSIPWGEVGIYRDGGTHPWDQDPDHPIPLDDVLGLPVVDIGDRPPGVDERFIPGAVEVRGEGDFEYEIESHVVWVSRDAEPDPTNIEDFESKRIVVIVRWDDIDGTERSIEIAAERSPPPTAIGFVDQSQDLDGDGVADSSDNCPHTYNPDQTDSAGHEDVVGVYTPPGVGAECDTDDDGHPEEDRTGNNALEDECPDAFTPQTDPEQDTCPDPDTTTPVIHNFAVNKQTGDGSFATQNRFCVSSNDATSALHRVRVTASNVGTGVVKVRYWYWKGGENTAPPQNESQEIQATHVDGTNYYDATIPQNTGKFRASLSTGIVVTVYKDTPVTESPVDDQVSDDNEFTQVIDLC